MKMLKSILVGMIIVTLLFAYCNGTFYAWLWPESWRGIYITVILCVACVSVIAQDINKRPL